MENGFYILNFQYLNSNNFRSSENIRLSRAAVVSKIVYFDSSAWKWFYPRVEVCAQAKRGWKIDTRLNSPSHSCIEPYVFIRVQSLI